LAWPVNTFRLNPGHRLSPSPSAISWRANTNSRWPTWGVMAFTARAA
jgi:hypothetical protein